MAALRRPSRAIFAAIALLLAFAQMWVNRGLNDPDGISYSDIAKAYLRGDWHNALSSYWSPLYSWLLAIGYFIFRPSIQWEILVPHAVNFIGFTAALIAWDWLFREWQHWQGPPQHRLLIELAGFSVITWAGLHLVNLGFTSADMVVMALTIALAAMLIRVRRGAAATADFVFLGIALALGFLAKASFETSIPVFLIEAAILLGTLRDRRLYIAGAIAFLVPLAFIAALSAAKGHFVVSDTGKVNYSAQVTGMGIEGYKENAFWPGKKAIHPISQLLDFPRVTGFEAHSIGTTPVHYDPAWWWEGFPVTINWPRQLMILKSNIGFCISRFIVCPALILAIVCLLWGAGPRMMAVFRQTWFIWLPAIAALSLYCLVYTLNRYLAGAFSLIAFCVIVAGWRVRLPRWTRWLTGAVIVLVCLSQRADFLRPSVAFAKDVVGKGDPNEVSDIRIAENLKRAGVATGDRVALIGNSIVVPWLSLLGATTVATVPETIRFDDRKLGRPQFSTHEKSNAFWGADPAAKERVYEAFRKVGAKWVIASNVPKWASTAGWKSAGHSLPGGEEKVWPEVFYKSLH